MTFPFPGKGKKKYIYIYMKIISSTYSNKRKPGQGKSKGMLAGAAHVLVSALEGIFEELAFEHRPQ